MQDFFQKSCKEIQKYPKTWTKGKISAGSVCVWVSTHQSRNLSSNYQVLIRLHQVNKRKENAQGHGFKELECKLFLNSIQAVMWSCLFAPVINELQYFAVWGQIKACTTYYKSKKVSCLTWNWNDEIQKILLQSIVVT